ncbi:MAG: mechanosensitive ion channel family protein [Thermoplasmata archaeon]|jgi:small-conductance mechanosensitive channel
MAVPALPRPFYVLARDLLVATFLAVFLFTLFTIFNHQFLNEFNEPEILILEAGGIILVSYLVGRAVTGAINALMARRGGTTRAHAVRLFLNLLIAVGAVLALFRLAGVSIESIFLGSALAGIVLGLAAQTVLANVFAGLLIVVADPFRPGDRVAFVSGSYGALAPSYPHEMMYPSYTGVVEDVGLIYTVLRLDTGGTAQVPNSVVLGALVLRQTPGVARSVRVRMTFPQSVGVPMVEAALTEIAVKLPRTSPLTPLPRIEVTDISATTWDGVAVVWTMVPDETSVRDSVLRSVLTRLPVTAPPK